MAGPDEQIFPGRLGAALAFVLAGFLRLAAVYSLSGIFVSWLLELMHKVCDIRNPNLRAELSPRALWESYARDLSLLMDRAVGSGGFEANAALDERRKAA